MKAPPSEACTSLTVRETPTSASVSKVPETSEAAIQGAVSSVSESYTGQERWTVSEYYLEPVWAVRRAVRWSSVTPPPLLFLVLCFESLSTV